jgi:hypothetical protein
MDRDEKRSISILKALVEKNKMNKMKRAKKLRCLTGRPHEFMCA